MVCEQDGSDGRELKSSPLKGPSPTKVRPPLGVRPGNDWKSRLAAVQKQMGQKKPGPNPSVVIVPVKRGRGRPPKNVPLAPKKIIMIAPAALKATVSHETILDETQFAVERPFHYIRHVPLVDSPQYDLLGSDEDEEEGWTLRNTGEDARIGIMSSVEYDMDEQDFTRLRLVNQERKSAGLVPLSEDDFELCIDLLGEVLVPSGITNIGIDP